jgi:transposase InsO family protein
MAWCPVGSNEPSAALKSILVSYAPLYAIWTDKGGGFQREFEKLLQQLKSKHITTNPYNPEQNGKCERFSPTIEMAPTLKDVPALIEEYNQIPPFGLPETMRRRGKSRLTPNEVWNDKDQDWSATVEPACTVDGMM